MAPLVFLVIITITGMANGYIPASQALVATTTPRQHAGGALALTGIALIAVGAKKSKQAKAEQKASARFTPALAPGHAGFVLANGSMSSNQSGEGEIRRQLVEQDMVDCMIALPGQLFYTTQIPVCLWFLARSKTHASFRKRPGETLFIDARKLEEYRKGHVKGSYRMAEADFQFGNPPMLAAIPRGSSEGWFGCSRTDSRPGRPIVLRKRVTTEHFAAITIRSCRRQIFETAAAISGVRPAARRESTSASSASSTSTV